MLQGAPAMLRREPYRLFFPLGLILAAAGVTPWILFARGLSSSWPGLPHALVMSQGFLTTIAVGFLATMGPRKTGTAPPPVPALALVAAGLGLTALLLLAGLTAPAEGVHLATLAALVVGATRRARAATAPLPPSFVLIPIGAALAATGCVLLVFVPDLPAGRALAAQGLMLCLVLAIAPMLLPVIAGARAWFPVHHLAAGAVLAASFAVEAWLGSRAGLALRGAVCLVALAGAGAFAPHAQKGIHRALFRLALLLVPLGLLAAALAPERRVALLHITYAGGFAGLILAVSIHVALFHGGRTALADRWPARVVVAAACLFGAVGVRAVLEGLGPHYLDAMVADAALFLCALAAWAAFLWPHLRWRRP